MEQGLNVLAHNIRDREVDSDFNTMLKQREVSLTPTLIRDEFLFAYGEAPAWIDDPFFQKFVSSFACDAATPPPATMMSRSA